MKILKYLFFLILLILIGGAIYFGTQDGTYEVSDSIVIDAPVEVVFDKVNDYKTWEEWGPWKEDDPTLVYSYAEKTSGEGASYSWEGELDGSMKTTKVIPYTLIEQDLTLLTPAGERNPKVVWNFEEVEEGTKVTWNMMGEHELMDKVYYSFSDMDFDGQMHEMQERGLSTLATSVKDDMEVFSINVDGITEYGGGYYMYTSAASSMNDVSNKMTPMMQEVLSYMENGNLQQSGNPFTLYNQVDENTNNVIFSTAVPVREKVITPSGSPVLCGFMEPLTAVKISLNGNYDHLSEAYEQGMAYLQQNNLTPNPSLPMFEVYITNPSEVPNPAEWVTQIYLPIITPADPNS
ncbi:MAG: AraC family transcriptional regulator [Flavobacteriaceae bacterium]|nr:AraC family transcriptional regulator [Flavobacteriaceae bacterium]